jgi:DNA invertase Pin-like site-specific DNA recombinase
VRAAVYVRISQDREGLKAGVERQEEDARKLASSKGWEVVEVYSDNDISATSGRKRPAYERMLRDIKEGQIDAIVAYSSSRLYRRVANLQELIDLAKAKGVEIATVVSGNIDLSSADGRMLAGILAQIDQGEAERTGERVKRAARQEAEDGRLHTGGLRPFGYQKTMKNGTRGVRIDRKEARLLRNAATRILAGESLGRITSEWNDSGIQTVGGSRWRPNHLKRLLTKPFHAGRRNSGTKGDWPALFSPDEHELLKAKLGSPAVLRKSGDNCICGKPVGPGRKSCGERSCIRTLNGQAGGLAGAGRKRFILTGLLRCSACGSKLMGAVDTYKCSTVAGGCGKTAIRAKELERWVSNEAAARWVAVREGMKKDASTPKDDSQRDLLLAELRHVEERQGDLAAAFADGGSATAFRKASDKLEAKAEEIRTKVARLVDSREPEWETMDELFASIDDWERRYAQKDLLPSEIAETHKWLANLISEVVVKPTPGSRTFNASRVAVTWHRR